MNSDRQLLVETLKNLLNEHYAPNGIASTDDPWDSSLWEVLEELGLTSVGIREAAGGSGGSLSDAALIVRTIAGAAAPIPIAESMLVAPFVRELVGLPHSPRLSTVAIDEAAAVRTRDGWRLNGRNLRAYWGDVAQRILIVLHADNEVPLVAEVDSEVVEVTGDSNIAHEPRSRVSLINVDVPHEAVGTAPDGVSMLIRARGSLSRSILIVGALETVLELTTEYARNREQFGRSIARFQVVRQAIAQLAGQVALSVAAVEGALSCIGSERQHFAQAAARVQTSHTATMATSVAHQVHGALGMTSESALQQLTRRLWSWRDEYGTEGYWRQNLGRRILDAGADDLWPSVVGG